MYNLPEEVKFCKLCVLSNQRPRIQFDDKGVCSACNFNEYKNNVIDWTKREKELQELCNLHRKDNGQYDVIVPASGGKDSNYVAHMLKSTYGMTPLTVTWAPHIYTDIGRRNLTSFIDSGFDNILITPRGDIHRIMTKASFLEIGDPFQPFIYGQYSSPFRAALQYNVNLVFYGEDGEVEYGGSMENSDRPGLDFDDFVKHRFSGVYPKFFANHGITQNDLLKYSLSTSEIIALKKMKIKQRFFSYYKKWVPQENFYYATENTDFSVDEERSEGTYTKFASLDDKLDGFHYYLAYIKFGHGRCTSDAAHEIRDGYITREEGVSLVDKFDGEFPKRYFKDFLEYCDISEDQFFEVVDGWRSDHLWEKKDNGFVLKHKLR
ncbi:N-acetyl sugar amidotransferase [Alphaproteobacteria bacterium]|nr:N-acetyl sugar amidotransferase [Alphaproteobacteria bacterium]